jgi:uncharacterized membrane protein
MNTGAVIVIIVVAVVLIAAAVLLSQQRRTHRLRHQFGPEYERTLARAGGQRSAESELAARERRRRDLDIVALEPAVQARYREAWRATQTKFVDDPTTATREADDLVIRVMRDRGYPMDNFEQRAADISVDHPEVAENYRAAHAMSQANEHGLATTDDLRQAFVHYRSLFAQLLDVDRDNHEEAHR